MFLSESDIQQIGQEVLEKFVIPSYKDKGHNASGELLASFRVRAEGDKAIISGSDQAQYLIFGRRPNKDQSPEAINNWVKWFAPNVFQPWMDSKGLSMNAYALAYSIARDGTKMHREGGESFLAVLSSQEVSKYIQDRVKGMATVRVAETLKDYLIEQMKE